MVQHGSTYVEAHPTKSKSGAHRFVNIARWGKSALLLGLLGALRGAATCCSVSGADAARCCAPGRVIYGSLGWVRC